MFNKFIFKLAKRFLTYRDIDKLYHHKKYIYDNEQYEQNLIIKAQAEKEILEFLQKAGANFQKELERQDFIGIRLGDSNITVPSFILQRELRKVGELL